MKNMKNILRRVWAEDGIQHVEEALLLGLVAIVAIAATITMGQGVDAVFTRASTCFDTTAGTAVDC